MIERKLSKEEDKVKIDSNLVEEVTVERFNEILAAKRNEVSQLKAQHAQILARIKELEDSQTAENLDELREFAKKVKAARELEEIEQLKDRVVQMDTEIGKSESDLNQFEEFNKTL